MSNSNIDAAIEAAKNKAAEAVPAVQSSTTTAMTTPTAGVPMSLEDFSRGNIAADAFLKVKMNCFLIGSQEEMVVEPIEVEIDMVDGVQVTQAIKYGNPATYLKTVDGQT